MKFTINREALLRPLQMVAGVVERRQTIPILSNVLLIAQEDGKLTMTGTDSDVELVCSVALNSCESVGATTVSARKLMDICKSLSEHSAIDFTLSDNRLKLNSNRSRFILATLSADDFPSTKEEEGALAFTIQQGRLRELIDSTGFSMANQDVRPYLNGMLMEIRPHELRVITTDGHRLALASMEEDINYPNVHSVLVPRKGVLEMARLLTESSEEASITVTASYIRAKIGDFTFTSRLIDGKFPDYERVLPKGGDKVVVGNRNQLRQVFGRAAILSNEKYRGVRMLLNDNGIKVMANNPEQEEAEDYAQVDYVGDSLEIVFNVNYLLDVLSVISSEDVKITLSDASSSALIEGVGEGRALYVIMPMHL